MHLKELTLKGFKSFASPTTLRFEPGITAVVGPNGSGKSNIVDALAWVMGEQGARNLRGTSMEDVIFAGTATRPALGRAQVTLTIDNADGTLDIDYTEVTISRTLFRNGGSEYAINGTPCRLLDVQELLSDTGLGQQMHVIVGQGRLDAILRADPAGHRAFIEEAAGILKHRRRKERALRKLANTETNLARLDDLLGEIRRQMGPLGRQARVSRKADGIQIALRDATARLIAADAVDAAARRDAIRAELTGVRHDLNERRRELARIRLRIEQVEAASLDASPAMALINGHWHELTRLRERLHALAALADERTAALEASVEEHPGENPDVLRARADELAGQAADIRRAADDAKQAYDQAVRLAADDEHALADVRRTMAELRRSAQERDEHAMRLRQSIARAESAIALTEARSRDFAAERDTTLARREECARRIEALRAAAVGDGDDGSAALDEARHLLSARQNLLNDLTERRHDTEGRIISLNAKADALTDALDHRDAADALAHDPAAGMLGRLTDFIRVEEGWEEAVSHALAAFSGAIVVPDTDAAAHALARAREGRMGRMAALAPLPAATDVAGDDGDSDGMTGDNGSAGSAAALVHANPQAPDAAQAQAVVRAVRVLLEDVAAAATLDEAMDTVRDGRAMQAVTRDGELVNRVAVAGGSSSAQSDLALAARRDKALDQVRDLRVALDRIEAELADARRLRDEARAGVERATAMHAERRVRAQQAAKAMEDAEAALRACDVRLGAVDERIAANAKDAAAHRAEADRLTGELETLTALRDGDVDPASLEQRERELDASLRAAREREVETRLAWSETDRKAESFSRQAGMLRDQAEESAQRLARIAERNAQRRAKAERLRAIGGQARAAVALAEQALTHVDEERDTLQTAAASHDEELRRLRAERDAVEPQVNDLTVREHALDVDRERVAAQVTAVEQRTSDELGMDVETLVRDYGPDNPVPVLDEGGAPVPAAESSDSDSATEVGTEAGTREEADRAASDRWLTVPFDRAEQEERVRKARRDLAALGRINPLAIEEYEALQTRNRYLNDQRNDVAASRDDLMGLIRELDATMADVFRSAFDDTAAAFETMFATLFPGGSGRLRLEDPSDPLTSGVIVEARPAGKRVRQLSLLSGGERSLTALALLLAIFAARPSPFYVMDEVEAALDDANLTRLLDAFGRLRDRAQLIVITHQQRTMAIADALYGVTMRDDGVTAVVSQRLAGRRDDE
ncbi:chromosome segregation protein SMC [Bifidobacterium samirii]|uniref:Chromosome partition protein Smc n=1 Tax=Bifidobacterium samirii TaxID=2306974 RepID=A0A430FUV6_9BIFI|nr:chromosome segregation protein SMC [Bifidobacterium samirii]RSX57261.1 chromosome segregation protein SMC [Bifidobacterium samirii]